MESTVIATIITVLGTGVLAGFGYFMKHLVDGISDKIDKLEADLNGKIDKLESRIDGLESKIDKLESKVDDSVKQLHQEINELRVSVAEIASTQREHSAMLQHMMRLGERVSALEGATFSTAT